jgi:hypothetical protein
MKRSFLFLVCAVALGTAAARGFVYENAFELHGDGDFDGNGLRDLIIVDKATGNYRIGYQLSPGACTWESARASGIANATGLGIGKLDSLSFDSIALTGPDANRVNLMDANNTGSASLPVSVFIPSLGPNVAAVIDIATNTPLADLYIASLYNGLAPYRETLVRNNGSTNQTVLADNWIPYLRERANPSLLHTNRPVRLALFERNAGVNQDLLSIYDTSTGAVTFVTSVVATNLPNPMEYVTGQFVSTNPYTQFLLYAPATSTINEYQVTEPTLGAYALVRTNTLTVTNVIDRMFVLPGTNGPKLLVLDTNGTAATVYNFDGHNPPAPVQAFAAAAGQHFTGAGVLGNSGFTAYSAPLGESTSSKFQQFNWTGSGYTNVASGDLPRVSVYTASGNVMQFQYEPFVTNNPVLLRLNNAGDWSSLLSFSGLPGNISVDAETFLSSTQGLVNPTITALGPAHPLAAFGLPNQYNNMISLFSFTPPAGDKISDVTISPAPGLYPHTVQLQFTPAKATDSVYFRLGSGAWITWSNGLVVRVFTNLTVQYYSQPASGTGKSAVKSAVYSFTQGPSTLDSNGDGIPDYVKIAYGLDPNGPSDSNNNGRPDLEELIHGINPLDTNNLATNYPHLDDQSVFDLRTTPFAWDGFSNVASLCLTGTVLHAYDMQGSLLSAGTLSNLYPAVRLTNIAIIKGDRLAVFGTDRHYSIVTSNSDATVGREMLGLIPLPTTQLPVVPYVFGGGNITNEANNWVVAASNAFHNLPRASITNTLTINNTLEALLFELKTAQILGARGSNWWTNMTLFPFRVSDAGRTNPAQSILLSLETQTINQPGYQLQTMFTTISNLVETSANPGIASLRAVVRDIYRIDSLYNNTNPAAFALPPDEIRYFLWNGTLESNYLAHANTVGQFASASIGGSMILSSVLARPTTNVSLVVRADTLGGSCRILDLQNVGTTFSLLDASGTPFVFPVNFQLLPGSVLQVSGYTDVTSTSCAYPAIQVISAVLSAVPIATDGDLNGNLLVDSWENRFFGGAGLADPFADTDGDGYSNLQEMLDGSDPLDLYGKPSVLPVLFAPPVLSFNQVGSQVELHFQWPLSYIGRFNFGVQHTVSLGSPFAALPATGPVYVAGNEFKMTFTAPATPQHFYLLSLSLR